MNKSLLQWLSSFLFLLLFTQSPSLRASDTRENTASFSNDTSYLLYHETSRVLDLGEIVIYGDKPGNSAATISELTAIELAKMSVPSVAEAMDTLPGVDARLISKGEKQIVVRGFGQNEMRVLIDGVPAYEGFFGSVDLGVIPIGSVEKIMVLKGASSLLYGANTMGGVVNIITKKGSKTADGGVSASLGENKTQDYFLSYSAGIKNWYYYFGLDRMLSDGTRLSGKFNKDDRTVGLSSAFREDGSTRELSDYQKYSLTANLSYDPGNSARFNLNFDYFNNKRGCPVFSNRYWRFIDWQQWQISAAMEKKLSSLFKLTGRTFYVEHQDELEDVSQELNAKAAQVWFDRSRYIDFSAGGGLYSDITFPGWLIKSGITYQKDRNRQNEYNNRNNAGKIIAYGWDDMRTYEADTLSFGLENFLLLAKRISWQAGCSYDYYRPIKSADRPTPADIRSFDPQTGLRFDLGAGTDIYSSIGKKIRFPRMKELYSKRAGGNPDLKPEDSIAFEIGLKKGLKYGSAYVSYFNNDVDNLIQSAKDATGNSVYLNIGKARLYGVETGVSSRIIKGLDLDGNYTYLYTWDKVNRRELDQRPRHKVNLGLSYTFPFGLCASGRYTYTGEQKLNPRTIREYHLVDLKVTQELGLIKPLRTQIFLAINNIMDINYEEGDGPMPGRNILAGLSMLF